MVAALTHYFEAHRLSPLSVEIWDAIAECYASLGRWQEAINYAARSFLVTQTSLRTTGFANLLANAGRQAEADILYAETAQNADVPLLMCYGQLFIQLEQPEKALAAYDLCASRRPLAPMPNTAAPASWIERNPYGAANPSPRYGMLIEQYRTLHEEAQSREAVGNKMFEGVVGFSIVAPYIKRFREKLGARSLLDYGGGRGAQYRLGEITTDEQRFASSLDYLGIEEAVCFDPGVGAELPTQQFDLVICIDALEHCDRLDLPWIVRGLFQRARLGVFANIACYPARKILPNGENAHCTIEEAPWWMEVFAAAAKDFPHINYQVIVSKDLQQLDRAVFQSAGLGK